MEVCFLRLEMNEDQEPVKKGKERERERKRTRGRERERVNEQNTEYGEKSFAPFNNTLLFSHIIKNDLYI